MNGWRESESTERPLELDMGSSRIYNYIRKDIEEVERKSNFEDDDNETYTMYKYKELKVKKEDWDLFQSLTSLESSNMDLYESQADLMYELSANMLEI